MSRTDTAAGLTFALTATAEELDADDDRPCVYCNSDQSHAERRADAGRQSGIAPEDVPEEAVTVFADYILRFGHKEGAGIEVPVCDGCVTDCPVEFDGQTTHTEMDFRYGGNGEVRRHVVETEDGREIHRYVPVQGQ